jgi:hypothetical protein
MRLINHGLPSDISRYDGKFRLAVQISEDTRKPVGLFSKLEDAIKVRNGYYAGWLSYHEAKSWCALMKHGL